MAHGRNDYNDDRDQRRHYERPNYDRDRRDNRNFRDRDRDKDDDRNRVNRDREDNRNRNDNRNRGNYNNRGRFDRYQGRNNDRRRGQDDNYRSNRHDSRDRSHSRERQRNDTKGGYQNRRNQRRSEENENYDWGKKTTNEEKKPPVEKEKPNFGLSGKLTEETNTYRGVVIKYSEPPEARKPRRRWRLYPFKGEKALPTLYVHRQSAYLMGRERKIADFPLGKISIHFKNFYVGIFLVKNCFLTFD